MGAKLLKPNYNNGHCEYHFYCPGCKEMHSYITRWSEERKERSKNGAPTWSFNGDLENPSFTPSLLYRWEYPGKRGVCHLYVTNGKIQFLGDCTHALAGQTVEMKDV